MRVKRFILPTLTMVIIASQLMGCAATNQSELQSMLAMSQQIEIEIATPISEQQGTEKSIEWVQLDQLNTYSDFRGFMDNLMKITSFGEGSKNGICYVNLQEEQDGNSVLSYAMQNRKFIANFLDNDTANLEVQQQIGSLYVDVEESDAIVAAINAYWSLLPDAEPNYFNPGQTLTRLEAMSLLARATTPVTDAVGNQAFTDAVGQTDYTDLASLMESDSYLTTSDKSLNDTTANGTITRGEYIYMLVSNIFGKDRMSSADIKKAQFSDCKNAGDIAANQKVEDTSADYLESAILKVAISNPDDGCPERMYQALATAQELGIISSETRWDEGLTKAEAIQLFLDTMQAYTKVNSYAVDMLVGSGEGVVIEAPVVEEPIEEGLDNESINVGGQEVEAEDGAESPEESTIESEYTIEAIEPISVWAATNCNLRSGPGTQYEKVGSLYYAQEVVVDGKVEQDGKLWYVLQSDDDNKQMVSGTVIVYQKPQPQQTSNGGNGGSGNSGTGNGGSGNTQTQPQTPPPAESQQPSSDDGGGAVAGDPAPGGGVYQDASKLDWSGGGREWH